MTGVLRREHIHPYPFQRNDRYYMNTSNFKIFKNICCLSNFEKT